jgi:hypothetical protein
MQANIADSERQDSHSLANGPKHLARIRSDFATYDVASQRHCQGYKILFDSIIEIR